MAARGAKVFSRAELVREDVLLVQFLEFYTNKTLPPACLHSGAATSSQFAQSCFFLWRSQCAASSSVQHSDMALIIFFSLSLSASLIKDTFFGGDIEGGGVLVMRSLLLLWWSTVCVWVTLCQNLQRLKRKLLHTFLVPHCKGSFMIGQYWVLRFIVVSQFGMNKVHLFCSILFFSILF